jgi:hypothetical protein
MGMMSTICVRYVAKFIALWVGTGQELDWKAAVQLGQEKVIHGQRERVSNNGGRQAESTAISGFNFSSCSYIPISAALPRHGHMLLSSIYIIDNPRFPCSQKTPT